MSGILLSGIEEKLFDVSSIHPLIWLAAIGIILVIAWALFTYKVITRVNFRRPSVIGLITFSGLRILVALLFLFPWTKETIAMWFGIDDSYRSLIFFSCKSGMYGFLISLAFTAIEGLVLWSLAKNWPRNESRKKQGLVILTAHWVTGSLFVLIIFSFLALVCAIF